MCLVRSRCLISSAVSKPSSPGIWTSSRMNAKSWWSSSRSASSPERRADEVLAERLEDRLEREQVLRAVVDEQDVDDRLRAHVVSHPSRRPARRAGRRGTGRSPRAARTASAGRGGERGGRHLVPLGASPGPARSRRRRALDPREPGRAVGVRAVRTTPTSARRTRRRPTRTARRSTAARTGRLVDREREVPGLDEQVVVGRREVDVPRLDRHLVLAPRHTGRCARCASSRRRPPSTASVARCCATTIAASISAGSAGEQQAHGLEPAPRRADHDQVVVHATFRQSFSPASSSS